MMPRSRRASSTAADLEDGLDIDSDIDALAADPTAAIRALLGAARVLLRRAAETGDAVARLSAVAPQASTSGAAIRRLRGAGDSASSPASTHSAAARARAGRVARAMGMPLERWIAYAERTGWPRIDMRPPPDWEDPAARGRYLRRLLGGPRKGVSDAR